MKHSKLMLILVLALFAACEEVILIMKMIVFLRKIIIWMVSLRANEKSVHLYTKKSVPLLERPFCIVSVGKCCCKYTTFIRKVQ